VVAEPFHVPDVANIGDLDGLTAITWNPALGSPGVSLDRGSGYVAVEWAGIASPLTAAYQRSGTSWTGSANASEDAFPARSLSSVTSTPTLPSGETLQRTPEEDG
jgi:hypothetical protein